MTDIEAMTIHRKYEDLGYRVDEENFKHFILDRVQNARTIFSAVTNPLDMLYLLEDEELSIFTIPEATEEKPEPVVTFFEKVAESYKGKVNGYIYVAAVWALSIDVSHEQEVERYTENPELILDNPFKKERIVVVANGWGQTYDAYQEFERDDVGNIIFNAEPVIDDAYMTSDTVADILLPVLK